jgi:hypothetical protein
MGLFFALPIIYAWFTPKPPLPEITYGEFPFRIEYQVGEDYFVIEDTVICEFEGFVFNGASRLRSWREYLASSGESDVILSIVNSTKMVCCDARSADYYMGDNAYYSGAFPPSTLLKELSGNKWKVTSSISAETLLSEYGIKLINWEFSDPIENTFK